VIDGLVAAKHLADRSEAPHERPEDALAKLDDAVAAARTLGIPTDDAERTASDSRRRLGFPSDVYVLALVGGTGVGKSSLLNALSGATVSPEGIRRPTTTSAVAWLPRASRDDLAGLLEWLSIGEVHDYDAGDEGQPKRDVAILDLPDIDSIEPSHIERVDELLPRLDAVIWVTDPEKYHDAVLHDAFLARWLPRLGRQAIVLNKTDRLRADEVSAIRRELEGDLQRLVGGPADVPAVLATSTRADGGLDELRTWLDAETDAKAVVRDRIRSAARTEITALASAAGVGSGQRTSPTPLVAPEVRTRTIRDVERLVMAAIDPAGLERQAVAATRARARRRGTGPMGLVTDAVYRLSGREAVAADPRRFLGRWRERRSLSPAIDAIRRGIDDALATAPPGIRPTLAGLVEPAVVRRDLDLAIERALAVTEPEPPSSRLWPVIGALQTIATGGIVLTAAWILVWILAHPPVDVVSVPVLGQMPVPFLALVAFLVASYLLARLIGLHAGWIGRRWAGRLRTAVEGAVRNELETSLFGPIDRIERARVALWRIAS
jgi:GTPase SAR1 family protein